MITGEVGKHPSPVSEADGPRLDMESFVMKRHRMSSSASKHHFTKHGVKVHRKNVPSRLPMRGGIRL